MFSSQEILDAFNADTRTVPDIAVLHVRRYFTDIPKDDAGGKFLRASESERERMRLEMVPVVKPLEPVETRPRRLRTPLTEQDARDIRALSRVYSTRQLGKRYGVSHYTIWRMIQKVPQWHEKKVRDMVGFRADFAGGVPRKEIAKKYGISLSTVYLWGKSCKA